MTDMKAKRFFYRDPLAAEWMAQRFGMRFVTREETMLNVWEDREKHFDSGTTILFSGERYYVHPDSQRLLEFQLDDIVLRAEDGQPGIVERVYTSDYEGKAVPAFDVRIDYYFGDRTKEPLGYHIISRNGIVFMWPESEEA